MQLTIVIPALNEEKAIGGTIERCLDARKEILQKTGLHVVRIVVVSDGSTDGTVSIARAYSDVELIVFDVNQGYGAAIKAGWAHGNGDLLAFLDADGTCDPLYFIPMCQRIIQEGQDIVLGCRMGKNSQMPPVRKLGNTLFALLLWVLSKKKVRDTASGMRVIRRDALPRLLPLPDGMHFTPAISARALMDNNIKIAEIDMEYHERIGKSKLSVLKDGIRFLNVIFSAAAYIKISRITIPIMTAMTALSVALMFGPLSFYLMHRRLEEWMFYRYSFSGMIGTLVGILLSVTIVSEHVSALSHLRYNQFTAESRGLWRYQTLRAVTALAAIIWLAGFFLNIGGFYDLLTTGHVTLHWSRVLLGAYATIFIAEMAGTLCILKVVRAMHERQPYIQPERFSETPASSI